MRKILLWIILLLLSGLNIHADSSFELAAVQLEVHFQDYHSKQAFWDKIDSLLEEVFSSYPGNSSPELVVFPEYTGVFYTLIPFVEGLDGVHDLESAAGRIPALSANPGSLENLFFAGEEYTLDYIEEWSRRAAAYSVSIIAGSIFIPHGEPGQRELRNRALVFNSKGELFYSQDKVFLTDFESDICRLSPGTQTEAVGFVVNGRRIYLTICRDTYLKSWAFVYREPAFLWIDIKANGEFFNTEQRRSFSRALPARLPLVPVKYGLTLCLVGDYLDFFWEGESSLIRNEGRSVRVVGKSTSWSEGDIIYLSLPDD